MKTNYTILVVDDALESRDTLQEMLRGEGYSVVCASNGREALRLCSKLLFDLFLIDIVMPELGGLGLLKEINVFDNTYEAIMMTGNENLEDVKEAMELGAFCYCSKPLGRKEITGQVRKALSVVEVKKQRLERFALLEKKVKNRSDELESMVRLLEYQGQQLDAIINSMGEGLIAVDNRKSIVLMNQRAERMAGVRFADCAGREIESAFKHFASANKLSRLIDKGPTPGKGKNVLSIAREGEKAKYFLVNVQKIFDKKGECSGTVIIFLDQTETINAEQMRNSFLSIAAHELRTPINIIMNYLSLLRSQWENSIVRDEALDDMRTANLRLKYLVNRIVSLASLSDLGYATSPCTMDVEQIVVSESGKIQPEADDKKITITFENRLKNPTISTDPHLLRTALCNVLSNAIKFNRIGGSVRIVLEGNAHDENKDLSITVADEGEGLSERARNNLFESFMQGEDPLIRRHGGLGTGLYLARRAAEILGGSVTAQSEKGKGSRFTIRIPV
jgi:two-component system, OmpR family, phosphate regulon sensor histidine kinase PhoR